MKDLEKIVEEYNPLNNSVSFKTTNLSWDIEPNFELEKSQLKLHLNHEFKENNVTIDVITKGKINSYSFKPGEEPVDLELEIKKEFIEEDLTIKLNIDSDSTVFHSGIGENNFKATLSFHKRM